MPQIPDRPAWFPMPRGWRGRYRQPESTQIPWARSLEHHEIRVRPGREIGNVRGKASASQVTPRSKVPCRRGEINLLGTVGRGRILCGHLLEYAVKARQAVGKRENSKSWVRTRCFEAI